VIAHVGPFPLEELAPALAGAGSAVLVVRVWLTQRLRRREREGR
jgi:hypothetical protein